MPTADTGTAAPPADLVETLARPTADEVSVLDASIPSHVFVPTSGSIHEVRERGDVLVHTFGVAWNNRDQDMPVVRDWVLEAGAETG